MIDITHINRSSLASSIISKSIDLLRPKCLRTRGLGSSGSLCQCGVIFLYFLLCHSFGEKISHLHIGRDNTILNLYILIPNFNNYEHFTNLVWTISSSHEHFILLKCFKNKSQTSRHCQEKLQYVYITDKMYMYT